MKNNRPEKVRRPQLRILKIAYKYIPHNCVDSKKPGCAGVCTPSILKHSDIRVCGVCLHLKSMALSPISMPVRTVASSLSIMAPSS